MKRFKERREHRPVPVRGLDEELGLGSAARGFEALDGLAPLVRMDGEVPREAKALAVQARRHQRHENRRGAHPRHDPHAQLLRPRDDLRARVGDAGAA